ncbi:glutathione S-transferase L3-like [Prunus yedoensis var. nudiflora]|uniref:Glutathione S-transferase L3-like n=1 Tax=Prunus yedoensis var. nudiflora TaxID=2094558 RepID=A0A314UMB4_PRUYE|nr:glutathione S-transferase L3-like [Prunus yedoensis var. nudiflora]
MAYKHEDLSPPLDSTSSPPPLFDGTTRLYVFTPAHLHSGCGSLGIIRLFISSVFGILTGPLSKTSLCLLGNKEKVYPENKVPSLEHNGKVIGESLDLIKYVDSNFEGPSLFPTDPERRKFGEELITYTDTFTRALYSSFKGDAVKEADAQFDYLENALKKFDDGPFFLGQFSLVDIAYIPFVERFQVFLSEVFKYDITAGRPKLAAWFEEINKIEAYKVTKTDPKELVEFYKKRFLDQQ